jgi:hypothetical protein
MRDYLNKWAKLGLSLILLTSSAFADVRINVVTRDAASIFEILDNVSDWYPGFCDSEYREFWKKNFTITSKDNEIFKKYKVIREKYYNDPDQKERDPLKNRNGFFSTIGSLSPDPYAESFYSSQTLKEAYIKLSKLLTTEELSFIKSFYTQYSQNYRPLIKETRSGYKNAIKAASKSLMNKNVKEYIRRVTDFYGVKKDLKYEIIFVWWPPIKSTRANPTGKYLVMKNNPIKHGNGDYSDIALHELIHSISRLQSLKQKKALSNEFLKRCNFDYKKIKRYLILEEPLAVILGQMYYQEKYQPEIYKFESKWYNNEWINFFAKLYYPVVKKQIESNKPLDISLVKKLGDMCKEFKSVSKKF